MIVNIEKILHISPALGGRFEALLENDEKVIISRLYVPILKNRLGVRLSDEYQRKEYKGKNFRRSIKAVCPEWLSLIHI